MSFGQRCARSQESIFTTALIAAFAMSLCACDLTEKQSTQPAILSDGNPFSDASKVVTVNLDLAKSSRLVFDLRTELDWSFNPEKIQIVANSDSSPSAVVLGSSAVELKNETVITDSFTLKILATSGETVTPVVLKIKNVARINATAETLTPALSPSANYTDTESGSVDVRSTCSLREQRPLAAKLANYTEGLLADKVFFAGYGGRRAIFSSQNGGYKRDRQDLAFELNYCSSTRSADGSYGGDLWHRAATYGKGLLIAVGGIAHPVVQLSRDGETWSRKFLALSESTDSLLGIAFGRGRFIAVGGCGLKISSDDGYKWKMTAHDSTCLSHSSEVVYGGGRFVTLRSAITIANSANLNLDAETSSDGTNWSALSGTPVGGLKSLVYGAGRFVAFDRNGQSYSLSDDDTEWKSQGSQGAPSLLDTARQVKGSLFVKGVFHAWFGSSAGTSYRQAISNDGVNWQTSDDISLLSYGLGFSYSQGRYYAQRGGWQGSPAQVLTSIDGAAWKILTSQEVNTVNPVSFGYSIVGQ